MAAVDNFSDRLRGLDSPPKNYAAVVTNDGTDLTNVASILYIGGAGDVVVDTLGGQTTVTFKAVPVGSQLVGAFTRVRATGTTATNILAGW